MIAICPNCHQAFHKATICHKKKLIDLVIEKGYTFSNELNLLEAYGISG